MLRYLRNVLNRYIVYYLVGINIIKNINKIQFSLYTSFTFRNNVKFERFSWRDRWWKLRYVANMENALKNWVNNCHSFDGFITRETQIFSNKISDNFLDHKTVELKITLKNKPKGKQCLDYLKWWAKQIVRSHPPLLKPINSTVRAMYAILRGTQRRERI